MGSFLKTRIVCTWLFGGTLLGFAACSSDSPDASDDDDDSTCREDCAGGAGEASGGTGARGGSAGSGQGGSGGTDEGGNGGDAAASGESSGGSGGKGGATGGTGGSNGGSGGKGGATGGTGGSTGGSGGANGGTGGSNGGSSGDGGVTGGTGGGDAGTGGSDAGTGGSTAGASTGGSAGSSGATAGTGGACSSCVPGSTADTLLIQNFENASSLVLPHGSRNGSFLTYVTGSSTVDPPEDVAITPECTGVNGNCYRICATGAVSGTDYPVAAIAVDLNAKAPYDLSTYSGIAFDLSGQIGNGTRLDFHVSTVGTTDVAYGGSCTAGVQCQDHYSITTSLTPQTVYFSNLTQGGWGYAVGWNPAQVLELHWQVTSVASTASSQAFTICVDDVRLVE